MEAAVDVEETKSGNREEGTPFRPPWSSPAEWREINAAFAYLMDRLGPSLDPAREQARRVEAGMTALFPLMDDLCAPTCPDCSEPCCRVATLWYNFDDLLFLHLRGISPPDGQPMTGLGQTCRFLGPVGCRLHRLHRPWICTWYICPPQTRLLRHRGRELPQQVDAIIADIKAGRAAMEAAFLRAVN